MTAKDTSRARRLTWLWLVLVLVIAVALGLFGRRHPNTVDTPGARTGQGVAGPVAQAPTPAPSSS
jgi:Na+/proline symporter